MTDARPVPAAATHLDRSPAAPLLLWLVIQLLALSLGVFRVPLAARSALPGEPFALHALLVVQVIALAALFPLLLRDAATSAMVILTAVPFVQLASYLASIPPARAALAGLYVASWLVALAVWRPSFRTRRTEMLGVACALALSLGGAIVWYARAESRDVAPIDWSWDALFGPILGAIAQVEAHPSPPLSAWVFVLSLMVIAGISRAAARKRAVGKNGKAALAP